MNMRLVLQRVKQARVETEQKKLAEIDLGLLILAGFGANDHTQLPLSQAWSRTVDKIISLRIFPDHQGRSNLDLHQVQGKILLISQFTLFADCRKGRRPSFARAADPDTARNLYGQLYADLLKRLPARVEQGMFGAEMDLTYCNWGPLTIILDSDDF